MTVTAPAPLDLRTVTAAQVIDALVTLEGLRCRAGDLEPGDRIVFHRDDAYNVATVASVDAIATREGFSDWVRVTLTDGRSWKCSPKNIGQYRLPTPALTDALRELADVIDERRGAPLEVPAHMTGEPRAYRAGLDGGSHPIRRLRWSCGCVTTDTIPPALVHVSTPCLRP